MPVKLIQCRFVFDGILNICVQFDGLAEKAFVELSTLMFLYIRCVLISGWVPVCLFSAICIKELDYGTR